MILARGNYGIYPCLLGRRRRLDGLDSAVDALFDDVRDVLTELGQYVGIVDSRSGLNEIDHEEIRKAAAVNAVKRGGSFAPLVGECETIAAVDPDVQAA